MSEAIDILVKEYTVGNIKLHDRHNTVVTYTDGYGREFEARIKGSPSGCAVFTHKGSNYYMRWRDSDPDNKVIDAYKSSKDGLIHLGDGGDKFITYDEMHKEMHMFIKTSLGW